MIHIKRLQEEGVDVIALIGEIDASSSIELDLAIAKSVGEGFTRILVDCHSLEYISSAALSFFVNQVAQVRLGKLVDVEGASIVNYFENDWITLLHDDVDLKEFPGVALMRMYHQV